MDRIFLDANVLFSAAYLEHSGLARLWTLQDTVPLTSAYAIEEARRNLPLDRPAALARLKRLIAATSTVAVPQGLRLPKTYGSIRKISQSY